MKRIIVDLPDELAVQVERLLVASAFAGEAALICEALRRMCLAGKPGRRIAAPPAASDRVQQLAGVDGCKRGWVVARSDRNLCDIRFEVLTDLGNLFQEAQDSRTLVLIDVPIGLPGAAPRPADREARGLLSGGRKSSVFPCPARAALDAESYLEACTSSQQACGLKSSKQAFALLPNIREVDRLMSPALQDCVREAHPEVTFAVLSAQPPTASKKTPEGARERLALLADAGIQVDVAATRARLRAGVTADDILDAAACLASAYRVLNGQALVCGDAEKDARDLRMEITA